MNVQRKLETVNLLLWVALGIGGVVLVVTMALRQPRPHAPQGLRLAPAPPAERAR